MLEELMQFIKKHKITFVRSASSNHELVLSHQTDDGFVDYIFDEECSDVDILYKCYPKANVSDYAKCEHDFEPRKTWVHTCKKCGTMQIEKGHFAYSQDVR